MSDPVPPREQVFLALAAQLTALAVEFNLPLVRDVEPSSHTFTQTHIARNAPEPVSLEDGEERLILVDGDELKPEIERMTGFIVRTTAIGIEGYVKAQAGEDPGEKATSLATRVLAATLRDRTLGGVLYGKLTSGTERPHFTGMEEGEFRMRVLNAPGAAHGAEFVKEMFLQYATTPEDPTTLVHSEEGDG